MALQVDAVAPVVLGLLVDGLRSMAALRPPLLPWLAQEPLLRRPHELTTADIPQVR